MTDQQPEHVASVERLADLLELDAIVPIELQANAVEEPDPARESVFRIATVDAVGPEHQQARFRLVADTPDASYVVVIAVLHKSPPIEIERQAWRDYIEQVSFMAAYPYLREQVAGLAARMGRAVPTLPVMRRGDFQLPPDVPARPEDSVEDSTQDASAN